MAARRKKIREERRDGTARLWRWLLQGVITGTKFRLGCSETGDESQIVNLQQRCSLKAEGGVQMGLVIQ